jgi:hypothetical protein
MNWADTLKATALAALAGRTATAGRIAVDTPWSWNPRDVWLSRVRASSTPAAQASKSGPTVAPQLNRPAPDHAGNSLSTLKPARYLTT